MLVDRCYAVTGNVYTGPMFCGYPAKTWDVNGRPVCGVHKKGQPGILWFGTRYRYPEGTQDSVGVARTGRWKFAHGEPRP